MKTATKRYAIAVRMHEGRLCVYTTLDAQHMHEPVTTYWCRFALTERGFRFDDKPESCPGYGEWSIEDSPEAREWTRDWLERNYGRPYHGFEN